MKKIEAIVQPFKLDDVKEALRGIGVDGLEYTVDLLPKVKVEMVVPDSRSDEIVRTLVAAARTGKIGDGKIFIYEVAEAIRIRNDDRGDSAL